MIPLLVTALLISALFSGAESVLLSAHRLRLGDLVLRDRRRGSDDTEIPGGGEAVASSRKLATILVGNTTAAVFFTSAVTLWAAQSFGERSLLWVVPAVTVVLLLFGELVPKSVARAHATALRPWLAPLVGAAYFVFRPAVAVVSGATLAVLRVFGLTGADPALRFTRQDLQLAVMESDEGGSLAPVLSRILRRALDFADTPVESAMLPRTRMVSIPLGTTLAEAGRILAERRLSRLPVYRDDLDHIVGLLHRIDLFRAPRADLAVDGLLRPVHFVPDTKSCHELLRELQARRQRMAIVLDEYGGTAGLVTMEDLLEELFGEIRSENEPDVVLMRPDAATAVVRGATRADELREATGFALPDGDFETVAGYLLEHFGQVPKTGETVAVGGYRIEVVHADERRIDLVAVRREQRGRKAN